MYMYIDRISRSAETPSSSSYLQQLPSINEYNESPLEERELADFGEITGIGEFQDPVIEGTRGVGPLKKRCVFVCMYTSVYYI
jgi:hypothetical protein